MSENPYAQLPENTPVLLIRNGAHYVALRSSGENADYNSARQLAGMHASSQIAHALFSQERSTNNNLSLSGFRALYETESEVVRGGKTYIHVDAAYQLPVTAIEKHYGPALTHEMQLDKLPTYELKDNALVLVKAGEPRTPPAQPHYLHDEKSQALLDSTPTDATLGLRYSITAEEMQKLSTEDQEKLAGIRATMRKGLLMLRSITDAKSDGGRMITQAELDALQTVAGDDLGITNNKGPSDRLTLSYKFVSDETRDFATSESGQLNQPVLFSTDSVKLSR